LWALATCRRQRTSALSAGKRCVVRPENPVGPCVGVNDEAHCVRSTRSRWTLALGRRRSRQRSDFNRVSGRHKGVGRRTIRGGSDTDAVQFHKCVEHLVLPHEIEDDTARQRCPSALSTQKRKASTASSSAQLHCQTLRSCSWYRGDRMPCPRRGAIIIGHSLFGEDSPVPK
jgi:hypothetical protein